MLSLLKRFLFKEDKRIKVGWVNLYERENGLYRLSGGNTYPSFKDASEARRGSYTESRFLGTVEVEVIIKGKVK